VPYFQQRDSAQLNQRDRTCFSSSCAMLLEALKPGTLQGANGDEQYLAVVQRYGVTTDANTQLQALAHYGVTARLVPAADFELIEEQIARGIPVPCGTIHRGPVDRPAGSGHWLIVVGHTPTHLVVNDPWGEPDLLSSRHSKPGTSNCARSKRKVESDGDLPKSVPSSSLSVWRWSLANRSIPTSEPWPLRIDRIAMSSIHHCGNRMRRRIRQSGSALRKLIRSLTSVGVIAGSEATGQSWFPRTKP
jgi:hypothetical protein